MPGTLNRPPHATGEGSYWLPRHRKSAGAARRLLRRFLANVSGGEQYVDVSVLVLTELVNNAVKHGRTSPGRLIFVRFELSPGALRVEVHDANGDRPALRRAGVDDECGRGLWLVDQLSDRWGCCPRAGGVGKAVWAEIGPAEAFPLEQRSAA